MSDAIEVLNPNRSAPSTPPTFGRPGRVSTPSEALPPQKGAPEINPAHVRALIDGIKLLRSIEGMTDEDIVDFIMQAISLKGLQLSYEDIRRLVEAVPAEAAPAEGTIPPGENIPEEPME